MENNFTPYLLALLLLIHLTSATQDSTVAPRQDSPPIYLPAPEPNPHALVPPHYTKIRAIHATAMSLVFLVIFPIGACIIRRTNNPSLAWAHAIIQMVGFWIFIAAAGMGIWMGKEIQQLTNYHPTLGILLLILLALQPTTELINHLFYHRHPKLIITAYIHLWLGRALLVLGVVQGGLGFLFAASFPDAVAQVWPRFTYGALAVVAYLGYLAVGVVWPEMRGIKEVRGRKRDREVMVEMPGVGVGMEEVMEIRRGRKGGYDRSGIESRGGWV